MNGKSPQTKGYDYKRQNVAGGSANRLRGKPTGAIGVFAECDSDELRGWLCKMVELGVLCGCTATSDGGAVSISIINGSRTRRWYARSENELLAIFVATEQWILGEID